MTTSTYATIAASTLLATACTTANVQKNEAITETGLQYAEQVDSLLGKTIDTIIDVDSTELWNDEFKKKKKLVEKNQATIKLTSEVMQVRKSNIKTKRYFEALDELIHNPSRTTIGVSIGDISTAIARENYRRKHKQKYYASYYDNNGYIKSLSHTAVNAYYSKQIQEILRRDAIIIGKHIDMQDQQLVRIAKMLKGRMKAAEIMFRKKYVEQPYLNANRVSEDLWKANRKKWMEMKLAMPAVDELVEAQKALKDAWKRLVQGDSKMVAIDHMLHDTSKVATTMRRMDNAPRTQTITY